MANGFAALAGEKSKEILTDLLDDSNARIKNFPAAMILGAALLFEGSQFVATLVITLPLLGFPLAFALSFIVTVTAYTLLYFIIAVNFRVTPFEGNITALGLTVLEFMPGISAFTPGIIGSMAALIVGSRLKDNLGKKALRPSLKLVARQKQEMQRMQQQHRKSERVAYNQGKEIGDVQRRRNEVERKEKEETDKKLRMASVARSFDKAKKKPTEGTPTPYSRSVRPTTAPPPANDNYESEFPGELERYDENRAA